MARDGVGDGDGGLEDFKNCSVLLFCRGGQKIRERAVDTGTAGKNDVLGQRNVRSHTQAKRFL